MMLYHQSESWYLKLSATNKKHVDEACQHHYQQGYRFGSERVRDDTATTLRSLLMIEEGMVADDSPVMRPRDR